MNVSRSHPVLARKLASDETLTAATMTQTGRRLAEPACWLTEAKQSGSNFALPNSVRAAFVGLRASSWRLVAAAKWLASRALPCRPVGSAWLSPTQLDSPELSSAASEHLSLALGQPEPCKTKGRQLKLVPINQLPAKLRLICTGRPGRAASTLCPAAFRLQPREVALSVALKPEFGFELALLAMVCGAPIAVAWPVQRGGAGQCVCAMAAA